MVSTNAAGRRARAFATLLLAVAAVTSAGCLPRQLVIWSPDASRAIVMDSNSTSLCNGDGKLARLDVGTVSAAAWLPDSKRALLAVRKSAAKWNDLAAVLDQPTADAVADAASDLEKAIAATPAEKDLTDNDAQRIMKEVFEHRGSLLVAALVYLRDNRPEALRKRASETRWNDILRLVVPYAQLAVCALDGESLKPEMVVLNSLKGVNELRLSRGGKAVAFVTGSDQTEDSVSLWAAPVAAGARPLEIADQVALYPDWSADGQYLAYIHATAQPQQAKDRTILLGALATRRVADASGNLLTIPPDAQDLAGLLFAQTLGVRCLADGRIIFSSADVTLPTTAADMPQHMMLFAFDPARPATLIRMIPRQSQADLPMSMIFELSPDQKQVSISGDGKVCVMTLATGHIEKVQPISADTRMLPSWRKAGELCFVIPPAKDDPNSRPQVGLWSAGKTRVISTDWPDEVLWNLNFTGSGKPPGQSTAASGPASAPAADTHGTDH
jgi:hypothetical protein